MTINHIVRSATGLSGQCSCRGQRYEKKTIAAPFAAKNIFFDRNSGRKRAKRSPCGAPPSVAPAPPKRRLDGVKNLPDSDHSRVKVH